MDASKDETSQTSDCPHCAENARRVSRLESELAALKSRLAKLEPAARGAKRQAAPFSKGPPKPDPKPPGRKGGGDYGTHHRRGVPPQIHETYEARLPDCCTDPNCPGRLKLKEIRQQYQTDIPREPIHRQFDVYVGECDVCHRRVQGRHPLQTSDALGAAAIQIGPNLQSLAVTLNKDCGMSYGKIERLMKAAFTVDFSRGGACRTVLRVAGRCEPAYQSILVRVRGSDAIVPDETGWRICGALAWLHVAVGADATAYLIHRKPGFAAAAELIGADFEGLMTHDGFKPYDRFTYAVHQACLGHLMRRAHELGESAVGGAVHFPRQVQAVFRQALDIRDRRDAGEISAAQSAALEPVLARRMAELNSRIRTDPDDERFAKHLDNLHESLFTFLRFEGMDATNHKAEQAIRPAVVNRKVWGGNRTQAGAQAQSILMSVLRTAKQRGMDAFAFISQTVQSVIGRRPTFALDTG